MGTIDPHRSTGFDIGYLPAGLCCEYKPGRIYFVLQPVRDGMKGCRVRRVIRRSGWSENLVR